MEMTMSRDSKILTYTGRWFDVFDPRPEDVDILDIAHALALTNRYGGHTDLPYSVAQHCVLMSQEVHQSQALWALLHDAGEAYLGDVPKPIKVCLPAFEEAEEDVMGAVVRKFNLWPAHCPHEVKDADLRMLLTEARDMMPGPLSNYLPWAPGVQPYEWTVTPWDWTAAKRRFLSRFEVLTAGARGQAAAAG